MDDLCERCTQLTTRTQLREIESVFDGTWYFEPNDGKLYPRWYLVCDVDERPSVSPSSFEAPEVNFDRVLQAAREKCCFRFIDLENCLVQDWSSPFLHYPYKKLDESAERGCRLCDKFRYGRPKYCRDVDQSGWLDDSVVDTLSSSYLLVKIQRPLKHGSEGAFDDMNLVEAITLIHVYSDREGKAAAGDPLTLERNVTQLIEPASMSRHGVCRESSLQMIRDWLSDCRSHSACNEKLIELKTEDTYRLPSRLLDVRKISETPAIVRLVETKGLSASESIETYASLSHCWGPAGLSFKLLENNYAGFCDGVSLSEFPPTFRDAILVASELGIDYIWIDALCIKQNDREDWEQEAPRMASVYGNSLVNFAATASRDSKGGLSMQNYALIGRAIRLNWTILPSDSTDWCLEDKTQQFRRNVDEGPLNTRGWVFQERLLAPRTINFAHDQIWWTCRQAWQSECDPQQSRDSRSGMAVESLLSGDWFDIVQDYSDNNFTKNSDRLIALAGAAEVFAYRNNKPPTDYLAGIWRGDDLLAQLLWHAREDDDSNRMAKLVTEEVACLDGYIAPSWSWANCSDIVTFIDWTGELPNVRRKGVMASWNDAVNVVDSSITLTNPSAHFGQVQAGVIEIECRLHPATFQPEGRWSGEDGDTKLVISDCQYAPSVPDDVDWRMENWPKAVDPTEEQRRLFTSFKVWLDGPTLVDASGRIEGFFFPVKRQFKQPYDYRHSWKHHGIYDSIWGLFLVSVDGASANTFRRIGLVEVNCVLGFWPTPGWYRQGGVAASKDLADASGKTCDRIRII